MGFFPFWDLAGLAGEVFAGAFFVACFFGAGFAAVDLAFFEDPEARGFVDVEGLAGFEGAVGVGGFTDFADFNGLAGFGSFPDFVLFVGATGAMYVEFLFTLASWSPLSTRT